jgi:hypothetical protein
MPWVVGCSSGDIGKPSSVIRDVTFGSEKGRSDAPHSESARNCALSDSS